VMLTSLLIKTLSGLSGFKVERESSKFLVSISVEATFGSLYLLFDFFFF